MNIETAQADVRRVYRGGSVGPLVSGPIWLVAAAVGTCVTGVTLIVFAFLLSRSAESISHKPAD